MKTKEKKRFFKNKGKKPGAEWILLFCLSNEVWDSKEILKDFYGSGIIVEGTKEAPVSSFSKRRWWYSCLVKAKHDDDDDENDDHGDDDDERAEVLMEWASS